MGAAVCFCRIEALQNVAKYASDTATAHTSASPDGTVLTVTISSNGCGFNPSTTAHGAGLTNMTDRIATVGGNLHIDTRPLQGTRITITTPSPVSC